MIAAIIESKTLIKNISCHDRQRFDSKKCTNSKM